VQSSTVLLMSCRGLLPKLDCAIFADTGWEPKAVYENLAWLEQEAAKSGIPVYRVTAGNLRKDALRSKVRVYRKDEGELGAAPDELLSGLRGAAAGGGAVAVRETAVVPTCGTCLYRYCVVWMWRQPWWGCCWRPGYCWARARACSRWTSD